MAEKEHKYFVLKIDDLRDVCDLEPAVAHELEHLVARYTAYRKFCKKDPDPKYIVCNQDEPYADKVWKAILHGEDAKGGINDTEPTFTSASIQGRSEALQIILNLNPEDGLEEYITGYPEGDSGDYSAVWDEKKLKELFHVGDVYKHSPGAKIAEEADSLYWEQMSKQDDLSTIKSLAARLIWQVENEKIDRSKWSALELLKTWMDE